MNTLNFLEGSKVNRFCLTFTGEARLWYESLQPKNVDWQGLQNLFRQQYSKIGKTRATIPCMEILSFWWKHRNNRCICNMHKMGSYSFRLWGTTNFRSIQKKLCTKLYWILFPIEDLRQAVETVQGILTKEKIDRQLAGQSSSTPFMSIKDNHNKRVTFDTWDRLEDKIHRLTVMMGQLAARDNESTRQFKLQIYQGRRRGLNREFYDRCNYNQWDYQNRYRSDSVVRRNQYRQNIVIDMNKITGEKTVEVTQEHTKILGDRIVEENTEITIGMKTTVEIEVGVGLEKDHFQEILMVVETIEV